MRSKQTTIKGEITIGRATTELIYGVKKRLRLSLYLKVK